MLSNIICETHQFYFSFIMLMHGAVHVHVPMYVHLRVHVCVRVCVCVYVCVCVCVGCVGIFAETNNTRAEKLLSILFLLGHYVCYVGRNEFLRNLAG